MIDFYQIELSISKGNGGTMGKAKKTAFLTNGRSR